MELRSNSMLVAPSEAQGDRNIKNKDKNSENSLF